MPRPRIAHTLKSIPALCRGDTGDFFKVGLMAIL